MADFDPDAYLAEPFDPDAYLAGAGKESFTQKLKAGAANMFAPEIGAAKLAMEPLQALSVPLHGAADWISRKAQAGQDKLGQIGAGNPTLEAFTTAGQGVLQGVKGVAQAGAALGSVSPVDVGLMLATGGASLTAKANALVPRLKLLAAAPAEVKAVEISKMVEQNGKKVVDEALSLAELQAKTGAPEKTQAAITMGRFPAKFTDMRRMSRPLGSAPASTTPGKPFTLQAGMDAEQQAALDAFRAKLPKTPETMSAAAPEPVPATIQTPAAPLPAAPAAPVIKAGEGFAGNINLSKYPKPVADLIKTANKSIGFAERQAQTIPELKAVGGTPEAQQLYKQIVSAPEGSVPGAIANAREVFNNEAKIVIGKLDNILSTGTDDIEKLVTLAKKGEEVSKSAKMAGQSLRVFKEAADSKLAQQLVDKAEELKIKAKATQSPLVQPYIDGLTSLQKAISKKAFDISQTTKFYRKTMEVADKVYYVYLNAILSNPMTHVRNIAGNVIFTGMKPVEKMATAVYDGLLSKLPGGVAAENTFGEAAAQIKAAGKALVGKGEKLPFDVTKMGDKLDTQLSEIPIPGTIGEIIGAPLKALKIEDDIAKSLIGQMEYAGLKARGLAGKELEAGVKKEAQYRTFQQESGPILKALVDLRDSFPGVKLVVPFLKTPTQLFMRGVERSPLGFGKVAYKAVKGNYKQAEMAADLGNATLGSMAAAFLAWQYGKGKISGSFPTDKDEQERWKAQGKLPYSIKINGRWRPLDRIEPIGGIVKIAIAGVDAFKDSEQGIPENKASEIAIRLGKELTSQSALNGFNNLSQAMSDPERYAGKVVSGIATGFVPGLSKFAADITDPYARQKSGIVETAKSKIPGLSQTLPPQRDVLGNPLKKDMFWGSQDVNTPELDFAKQLEVNLPDTKKLMKPITPLTTEEQNGYRLYVGNGIKAILQQEMAQPSYADPAAERKHIERQIGLYVDAGKSVFNVQAEFRNLGIKFSPTPQQAGYLYDNVIKNKFYKDASPEQKREAFNRIMLGGGL